MTRQHNQRFECPNCQTLFTAETLFGRWIRNNKALDSGSGFSITDCDYWIHKYKTYGNRMFQCIMLVEIKTNGADLSPAQRDTLKMVDQIIRNRRITPTSGRRSEAGNAPLKAWSSNQMSNVNLRAYGVHTLRFSALGPDDSETMLWDRNAIDAQTLTRILSFDLDPDTLQPIDFRSHHIKAEQPDLLAI